MGVSCGFKVTGSGSGGRPGAEDVDFDGEVGQVSGSFARRGKKRSATTVVGSLTPIYDEGLNRPLSPRWIVSPFDMLEDKDLDQGFPELIFSDQNRPPLTASINYNSKLKTIGTVKEIVGPKIWDYVLSSRLGVIAKFHDLNFEWCPKIVHEYLLCNQLVCRKPYELWFLIAEQPTRFSLLEFEDITGLNCERIEAVDDNYSSTLGDHSSTLAEAPSFFGRFPLDRTHSAPSSQEIEQLCVQSRKEIEGWSREDKIRLCYLAILSDFVLAVDRRSQIPFDLARLVMSLDTFEAYPWGRVCFRELCAQVKSVTEKKLSRDMKQSYVLNGFVQVLQVFVYVYVPAVGLSLGSPILEGEDPASPPLLLKYRGNKSIRRDISKYFEEMFVLPMSAREGNPFWDDDAPDPKIDNLMNYLREGKHVVFGIDRPDSSVTPPSKRKSRALGSPSIMTCSDEDEDVSNTDEFSDLEKTMEATLMFPRLGGYKERLVLQCLRNVDGAKTRKMLCEEWKVLLREELQVKIRKQTFAAARLANAQLSA